MLYLSFLIIVILLRSGNCQNAEVKVQSDYKPIYWLEDLSYHYSDLKPNEDINILITKMIDDLKTRGWQGVMFWGADRNGATMNYYFKSQFLEKQSWAVFKGDALTPLVKAAHEKGIKVVINIEAVDPYHWKENQWTAENIKEVAKDIAASGVDALHEECFEVNSDVFSSMAAELRAKGVAYVSGTDAMVMKEPYFTALWPKTGIIDLYNYYIKRDKVFDLSVLAQNATLAYGWAKYWNLPSGVMSPVERDWGINTQYSPAVVSYIFMIRALQFRSGDFFLLHGHDEFDPIKTQLWIKEYVDKQEHKRPLMDIVVLLKKQESSLIKEKADPGWNYFLNSGDAITSGAFNAGYDIIVSEKPVPADAYYVYAKGGNNDVLPEDVVALFKSDKPVFIQSSQIIPNGSSITPGWKTALENCGIDGTKPFVAARGKNSQTENPVVAGRLEDIPYTGYYKDNYLRFSGFDTRSGLDLRSGTIIPKNAVNGNIVCIPNSTYGKSPFIAGQNRKYVITATTINWEVAYAISDLLAGCGILPSSNVWGIAGKNVTALLAIETTELVTKIPGLPDGSKIHVVIWDNKKNKKSDETVTYKAPYKHMLNEYDLILIDKVN